MKLRYLLMAALLPMVLLCSCQPDDPEKIEADSSDMLALAESVLGMKEAAAVNVLKAADLKADDTEKNNDVEEPAVEKGGFPIVPVIAVAAVIVIAVVLFFVFKKRK